MTEATTHEHVRRLFVAWRDPESRRISPVGVLVQREDEGPERFEFSYLKNAELLPGFTPLPGFPDLHTTYWAPKLFPLFENRVMPRSRPDYGEFVERLDLTVEAEPFVVLGRSGGRKATDRIEVFPEPEREPRTGRGTCLFFARGIRHVPGAGEAVARLSRGDELDLAEEPDNPVNPLAIRLEEGSTHIGYVPDYLVGYLHDMRESAPDLRVLVEHVNSHEVPAHRRLLCRAEATWPQGYKPFDEPEFQVL